MHYETKKFSQKYLPIDTQIHPPNFVSYSDYFITRWSRVTYLRLRSDIVRLNKGSDIRDEKQMHKLKEKELKTWRYVQPVAIWEDEGARTPFPLPPPQGFCPFQPRFLHILLFSSRLFMKILFFKCLYRVVLRMSSLHVLLSFFGIVYKLW